MLNNNCSSKYSNKIQQPFDIINSQINKLDRLFQGDDMLTKQIYTALNQQHLLNQPYSGRNELSQYDGDITTKSIPFDDNEENTQYFQNNRFQQNQVNDFSQIANEEDCTILINGHFSLYKQKNKEKQKQKVLDKIYFNDQQSCIISLNKDSSKIQLKLDQQKQLLRKSKEKKNQQKKSKKIQEQNQQVKGKQLNKNISSLCISHFSKQKINKQLSLKKQMGLNKQTLLNLQDKKQVKKGNFSTNRKQTTRKQKCNKSLNNQLTYSGQIIAFNNKQQSKNKNIDSQQAINEKKKKSSKNKPVSVNTIVRQEVCNFKKDFNKISQKVNKKLNRINICQLQENIKKGNRDNTVQKNVLKQIKNEAKTKEKKQQKTQLNLLKLNFFPNFSGGAMQKHLNDKNLLHKYNIQKKIYSQICQKIDCSYWSQLRNQLQSPAENSIFKIKIVSLVVSFFSQFSSKKQNAKINSKRNALYKLNDYINKKKPQKSAQISSIQQEIFSKILQYPQEIVQMMNSLPSRLYESNVISHKYLNDLFSGYQKINDELDQQLDFFVLKKTLIFQYLHALCQYLNFLSQKNLLQKTQRKNVNSENMKNTLQGFYSSRGGQNCLKSNKKRQKNRECDSDRKKTISDEEEKVSRIWQVLNQIKRKNW